MENIREFHSPMYELGGLIHKCLNYPESRKDASIEKTRKNITDHVLKGGYYNTPVNYDKLEEFFKAVKEFNFENKTITDDEVKEHFKVLALQCIR